jgi:hypothetical protein
MMPSNHFARARTFSLPAMNIWSNPYSGEPSSLYHRIPVPLAWSTMAINQAQFRRMPW